jgi:beta-N-acetylhexosaminidase
MSLSNMSSSIALLRDAYAVLLPAFGTVEFGPESERFFSRGGVATLLGCSRDEYVARRMTPERQSAESPAAFRAYNTRARSISGGNIIVAVDYEIGGVHRLHRHGPQLSHPSVALAKSDVEIEAFGFAAGKAAKALGVNLILAPVLDAVSGENPWLLNRSLSPDPTVVQRITTAYIRGLQRAGVAATAKHFPGHHIATLDPYDDATSFVPGGAETLAANLVPFAAAVTCGVKCVMMGPVPVKALDPSQPSSTSKLAVALLREKLGFRGLVISDDLDLTGTMRGRSITEVAIQSLLAGVQLLLLASGPQVDDVAIHIANAVQDGSLPLDTVREAAAAVRTLADTLA